MATFSLKEAVQDAEGNQSLMPYDAHDRLAKQWQTVEGNLINGSHDAHTSYTANVYGALGRQTDKITTDTNSVNTPECM